MSTLKQELQKVLDISTAEFNKSFEQVGFVGKTEWLAGYMVAIKKSLELLEKAGA